MDVQVCRAALCLVLIVAAPSRALAADDLANAVAAGAQSLPSEQTEPADALLPTRTAPVAAPLSAAGNRAGENAVRQSSDAFGTVVGREAVGLYNADLVRGFSPLAAGNVRLDGLYFDTVIEPTDRTSGAITILIGPSVLGTVLPAPSGIVDYQLRIPGRDVAASSLLGVTEWGEVRGELDFAMPIGERLSVGLGTTLEWLREGDGRRDDKFEGHVTLNWEPSSGLQLVPFLSYARTPRDDVTPIYVPAGAFLPPALPRRTRIGPDWSVARDTEINAGTVVNWRVAGGWDVKAGLFRSQSANPVDGESLIEDVLPDGTARHVVLRDPPLFFGSTSGEARLTRSIADGPRHHRFVANVRGRDTLRRFDGSAEIDLGPTRVDRVNRAAEPERFDFSTQQRDRVRQWFGGLAYLGQWEGLGEVDLGLQYTDYRKRIGFIGDAPNEIDVKRLLYNLNAAVVLTPRIELYGGYVTGIEESGIAPGNAANRNEALPAITTRQTDVGLRWKITDDVNLIAGVFELSKPYFSIDANNVFRELGTLRNRGFETSMSGLVTPALSVNVGMLLLDPRVLGQAVDVGSAGPRAVGGIARRVEASADWRPPFMSDLSFDLSVSHRSPETATVDNRVEIPSRTLVALGGRRFFRIGGRQNLLRVQVENVFNKRGFELVDAGAYQVLWPRRVLAYLTTDF